MKKVYSKPVIIFESFSLSQNVAAGCEITNPKDPALLFNGMGPNGTDGYAFTESCDVDMSVGGGDGECNGICYHVFSSNGGMNLHNS